MFSVRWILFFLVLPLIVLTGCTRPQDETSKIQIVLPIHGGSGKTASQSLTSADVLMHVVINVSGDGFTPIVYIWDSCKGCSGSSTSTTAPSSFTLDIPMGSNRLIQALAVYGNSTTKSMSFYYGDTTKTLSQAQESATITISALTGATSVVTGQISGRYLTGSNQGPTGMVDIVYTPPGKPSLIIERSSIVNGWFQVFGLTGLAFGYRLPDGNLLFGKNLDLNDPVFAASSKVLRVGIPVHDRYENYNGTTSWSQEEPEIDILGYFGPAADTTYNVCRPAAMSSLTKLAKTGTATQGSNPLTYSGSAIPTPDALLSTATPLSSYYIEGGSSTGPCASPAASSLYVSYLAFSSNYIDGNGRESAAGFNAPFAWDANGKPIAIDSSSPRKISGTVLPGIESLVDGFALFKKPTTDQNFRMDSVDCGTLASLGFVTAGNGSVDPTSRTFTITSNISATEASSGVSAVLCPTRAGAVVGRGFFLQSWMFMNGGNSGTPVPADSYQLNLSWYNLSLSQCYNGRIELKGNGSFNVTNSSNRSFNMSVTGITAGSLNLYDENDTNCASPLGSTITINSPATFKNFRFMIPTGSAPSGPSVNAASSSFGSAMTVSAPFQFGSAGTASRLDSNMLSMPSSGGYCQPLEIFRVDTNGFPISPGAPEPVNIAVTPTGSIGVFSDPSCTSTMLPSFNLNTGEFSKKVYVKRLTGTGESSVTFTDSGLTSFTFTVDPTPWVDHLKVVPAYSLSPSAFIGSDDCFPVYVQGVDGANNPVGSIPGTINFSLGTNSGAFYSSLTACYSGSAGNGMMGLSFGPSVTTSSIVWYRNMGGGSSINLSVNQPNMRVANSLGNIGINFSTIPYLGPSTAPFTTPYAWFDMNDWADIGAGPVSTWSSRFGGFQFLDESLGVTPQLSSAFGGPWKSVAYSGTGASGAGHVMSGISLIDFTVAVRVRFNSIGTTEGILQFYGSTCNGSTYSCGLKKNSDGSLSFLSMTTAAGVISDTNFHTIMVVRAGSTYKILVDSPSPVSSGALVNAWELENYNSLKLGYTYSAGVSTWLNGNTGDLVIYNTDQSSAMNYMHNYLNQKTQ